MSKFSISLFSALPLFFLATALVTTPARADQACQPRSVSVSGEGSVSTAPGKYVFHLAVSHRNTEIPAANADVDKIVAAAVAAARKTGLRSADIKSTTVSIIPVYDPHEKAETPPTYEVTRYLTLTLREPSKYASLIEALIHAGINRIGNIDAEASDPQALSDNALAAAIADARRKAELIAHSLDVTLGPALDINESGRAPRPLVMRAVAAGSVENGAYVPGRISVEKSVTARFALEPSGCQTK